MELNQKQLLALAAIGAAFWYFTRKSPATAAQAAVTPAAQPAPAGGGIWDGFGVGGSLAQAMGQVAATAQPLPTPAGNNAQVITNTKAPVQTTLPASQVAGFGPGASSGAAATPTWSPTRNEWETAPGVAVDDSYAYGHLTPQQRGNKTDGQLTLSILGY